MDRILVLGGLMLAALAMALTPALQSPRNDFALSDIVPSDVFLYVAEQKNPERQFLDDYWAEVIDALMQTGICEDAADLLGTIVGAGAGEQGVSELERLRDRATDLVSAVDWSDLAGNEVVFVERLPPPETLRQQPPVLMPEMVWLFRGSPEGAARNYEGLVAILDAAVEEINRAAGADALAVKEGETAGVRTASVNLLAAIPGAPSLPLTVAHRGDIVIIAARERLFDDVLGLIRGDSGKKAIGADARFRAAFQGLPPAEDGATFFDMRAMLGSVRPFVAEVTKLAQQPNDLYQNSGMNAQAALLNSQALAAYMSGDNATALARIKEAYKHSPESSIVLYNLACFNALAGNEDEAMQWLDKAVDGGFWAPRKIAGDADLTVLHDRPEYKAALQRAADAAAKATVKDIVINSSKTGEAARLGQEAWKVYEADGDYEQCLKLVEQAYKIAPEDSRILYYLACFHSLLGHNDRALEFLERAVEGGFYCPGHITSDPDLENIRDDKRYVAAVKAATKRASELAGEMKSGEAEAVTSIFERLLDSAGMIDYVAAVKTTEGYSTRKETRVQLAPDAEQSPIYSLCCDQRQLTEFDRFLPAETVAFSVDSGVNPSAVYAFVLDSFKGAGPAGVEITAKLEMIQKEIGFSIEDDLLSWIEGQTITATLEGGDSIMLVKVRDEDVARQKVAEAITFLTERIKDLPRQGPAQMIGQMMALRTSPVTHEGLDGFANLHFAFSPKPAVWGVADGYLVLAASADAAATCLATARGEHPNIRTNERAMSEAIIPSGPFSKVSLKDHRGSAQKAAQMLGVASMLGSGLAMGVPEPEVRAVLLKALGIVQKATPVVNRIDFFKSTASCTTFDGDGWRSSSVTHYFAPDERGQ